MSECILDSKQPFRFQCEDANKVLSFKEHFPAQTAERQQGMRVLCLIVDVLEQEETAYATQIWVISVFLLVPGNDLIFGFSLIHLKKSLIASIEHG